MTTPGTLTPILGLESPNLESVPPHYTRDLDSDRCHGNNTAAVDKFAGGVTSSFYSLFWVSSSFDGPVGGDVGSEYTRSDRVIQQVVAYAAGSGSGGVTTIDVQVQQGPVAPSNFSSIFGTNGGAANAAMKVALSASLGNYGVASSSLFVSGSNMLWPAGTIIKTVFSTAAGAPLATSTQKGITIQVFWKPSGTYNSA